jgi:hypothetical protein
MKLRTLFSTLVLVPLFVAPLALADSKQKKEEATKTRTQDDTEDISRSSGPRSCSATSGDGKKSCAVSCKDNENAECSNTETEADCVCK